MFCSLDLLLLIQNPHLRWPTSSQTATPVRLEPRASVRSDISAPRLRSRETDLKGALRQGGLTSLGPQDLRESVCVNRLHHSHERVAGIPIDLQWTHRLA